MRDRKPAYYLLILISVMMYAVAGYALQRYETVPLFACYLLLFLCYLLMLQAGNDTTTRFWVIAALLFRGVLFFSVPALSDDFYRFIWDGRLLAAGIHPFAEVPAYYIANDPGIPGIDAALYNKLNSREFFTVYPPLSQLIFWLAAVISPDSVYGSLLFLKAIIFACEAGVIVLIGKILREVNLPSSSVLIYALNPLVILELSGNVHFEGIMILFLLLAIYLLMRNQWAWSALAFALSVTTKLIPLLFLPMLVRHLGWKRSWKYWGVTAAATAALFLPLLNADIVRGFPTSIGYYFMKFEFNASVYYLVRAAGQEVAGYNIIQVAGPVLALLATLLIVHFSILRKSHQRMTHIDADFFALMMWCLLIYFLMTTTLHPWYLVTLVMLGSFTPYRFPLLWSGLIFLTYAGYTPHLFKENMQLVTLEYVLLIAYLLYETIWIKRLSHS